MTMMEAVFHEKYAKSEITVGKVDFSTTAMWLFIVAPFCIKEEKLGKMQRNSEASSFAFGDSARNLLDNIESTSDEWISRNDLWNE